MRIRTGLLQACILSHTMICAASGSALECYTKTDSWAASLAATRGNLAEWVRNQPNVDVSVSHWYATGEIPYTAFGESHFPTGRADVEAEPEDEKLRWTPRRDWKDGQTIVLNVPPGSAQYLYRTVTAGDNYTATLSLGFDDCIEIWLNGERVFSKQTGHGCAPDQDRVPMLMKRGANTVLMKVYNQGGGCGFYYCLMDGRGEAGRAVTQMAGLFRQAFPREMDWLMQDNRSARKNPFSLREDLSLYMQPGRDTGLERRLIERVLGQLLPGVSAGLKAEFNELVADDVPVDDARWMGIYEKACRMRRAERLSRVSRTSPRIAFIKRHPVQPSFFGYTEGQSDAQSEMHFYPNSALCVLEVGKDGVACTVTNMLVDPNGVIRDLDVSWDGTRMLFAWKKSRHEDDYHLYEMAVSDGAVRPITSGKGVADYEGRYLPSGDLLFSSTRCVQTVDCWWTEVSNLYTCDRDGRYLRRLGFDQVHTICPSVLPNGQVVYTRWDYNDRGQIFPQGLFVMNPDGTGQTEFYGNNSWFPTTTSHARGIPGTEKVVAVLMGHHSWQAGKLAVIDPSKGRQEDSGVQLIAPVRDNPQAEEIRAGRYRTDGYGQDEELFRHPWPLNEHEFLVAMTPDRDARGTREPFGLYYTDDMGNRELLVWDPEISCDHPVPLAPRPRPGVRPSGIDYRESYGTYLVQDVYEGPGMAGVERGTVSKLRVVSIEYRAAGVGNNGNGGEAGGALISTPVSVGRGCWDVKRILGETPVMEDGSAFFDVPARTPVYFQLIDKQGAVIQTMRSWSTLMPGETFACVGCHEEKSMTPVSVRPTLAGAAGPRQLDPFHGPARGFSFLKEVQPILDRHCIVCHDGARDLGEGKQVFSLKSTPFQDKGAKRFWTESYLVLTGAPSRDGTQGDSNRKLVNWIDSQSRPSMLPPYHKGAAKSELMAMLRKGHGKTTLSVAELDTFAAWIDLGVPFCGDYLEANAWNRDELDKYIRYQRKREQLADEERRDIEALIELRTGQTTTLPAALPLYEDHVRRGPGLEAVNPYLVGDAVSANEEVRETR